MSGRRRGRRPTLRRSQFLSDAARHPPDHLDRQWLLTFGGHLTEIDRVTNLNPVQRVAPLGEIRRQIVDPQPSFRILRTMTLQTMRPERRSDLRIEWLGKDRCRKQQDCRNTGEDVETWFQHVQLRM